MFINTSVDIRKILLADDESAITNLFEMILSEALPHSIIDTAADGAQALAAFNKERHDVIVMDLKMPVMDGLRAAELIIEGCHREQRLPPRIVFCTGYAPSRAVRKLLCEDACYRLLTKPVDENELIEVVCDVGN